MLSKKQYETSGNFNARVYLTAKYGMNKESWHEWIFRHLPVKDGLEILELGCGTGLFWRINRTNIPADWDITLTDYSEGMIASARKNLHGVDFPFKYETADAQDLKHEKESFDIIIANLMLYHIPDRKNVLQNISCILKKGGLFIASTFGSKNMLEANILLYRYLKKINKDKPARINPFSLENGEEQLRPFFSNVKMVKYDNHLEITEAGPFTDYYLSFNNITEGYMLLEEQDIEGFRNLLNEQLKKDGMISVTKDTGMFICEK